MPRTPLPLLFGTSSVDFHDTDYSWHEGVTPSSKRGPIKVAVVSAPQSGHMLPVLHIAAELTSSGHSVTVYTCDFAVEQHEKKVKQAGATIVGLNTGGLTDELMRQRGETEKRIVFLILREAMLAPLKDALREDPPGVVLVDFLTLAGMEAAEELLLPLVINLPGPLAMLRDMLGQADVSTAWSFCGLHFARNKLSAFSLAFFINVNGMGELTRRLRKHATSGALLLVQTIWAVDDPQPLFPNVVVTGPVLPEAADLRQKLARDHAEISKFLNASGSTGVVYVTTGSLAELHKWQVEAIYHGLKKAAFPVVWSLKEKQQAFLPVKDDPSFYISAWTPQAELLQDPAVKVVITHCGWGGTLECVTAAKPVVCIPFFGDQPTNARLLVQARAGELIGKIPSGMGSSKNPYKEGDFTPDTVASAVTKVMGSESYKAAVQKMMWASRACGGAEMAVQQIVWAAKYGTGHLRSDALRATSGTSAWAGVVLGVATMALLACAMALRKQAPGWVR